MKRKNHLLMTLLSIATAFSMLAGTGVETFAQVSTDPDSTISVTGLQDGDKASYFQIIKYNTSTGAWELDDTLAKAAVQRNEKGETDAGGTTASTLTVDDLVNGINNYEAGIIAKAYQAVDPVSTQTAANGEVEVPITSEDMAGTYYFRITPNNASYIYNPVFVSSDFYSGGNSLAVGSGTLYESSTVAKKQEVTLDKTAGDTTNWHRDVEIGEVVDFHVNTIVPAYTDGYTKKQFILTDELSDGLELNYDPASIHDSIKVYATETVNGVKKERQLDDHEAEVNVTDRGYTMTLSPTYLNTRKNLSTPLRIEYSATVTSSAEYNVNEMENTAKLTYTNNPSGTTSEETDQTHHYTFTIGGKVLGQTTTNQTTHELVKIDTDKNGNPVWDYDPTKTVTTSETTKMSPLAGAKFQLFDENKVAVERDGDPVTCETTVTGDDNTDGLITFSGLGSGTYYIKETMAPTGYVLQNDYIKVDINPVYDSENTTIQDNDPDDYILLSYEVVVSVPDGKGSYTTLGTSTYTVNHGTTVTETTSTVDDISQTSGIKNVEGSNLPTTGGIGTTIFYVAGGVLIVIACVLLVRRRKNRQA